MSKEVNLEFELWPKQRRALNSEAQFVLYGGAAGGGKSHTARVSAITDSLRVPGLQTYFFRKHYRDLINNHVNGPTGLLALLFPLIDKKIVSSKELEFKFCNGSNIYLCHCQHEKDVWNYHGSEIHKLILEEAGQFSEFIIRFLLARVRIPDVIKIPPKEKASWPKILATTNPGGPSHQFFRYKMVEKGEGKLFKLADDDGGWITEYIPAKLYDNPSINPDEYRKALLGLKRKELIDSLLDGKWDVPLGAFLPECDEKKHFISPFTIPEWWFRFRTFDWGSAAPFCVLWWAVSDGSIEPYPKGALICYREWYGANKMDLTRGLGMSNEQMAQGVLQRTGKNESINGTVTDGRPFQSGGGITIAEEFKKEGVPLQLGDVRPGSRIQGWQQLRSRLIGKDEIPGIYFFNHCHHSWRTLTQLQTDPNEIEDCDTDGEDHAPDAISLACKARPYVREAPKSEKEARDRRIAELHNEKPSFDDLVKFHQRQIRQEADGLR